MSDRFVAARPDVTPLAAVDVMGSLPGDLRRLLGNGSHGVTFSTETHVVPIARLALVDSPRLAGEDLEHVRRLTDVETTLPPILVHRPTMRVIDGRHRLRAAMSRGQEAVRVRFFDGPESHVFALAVGTNIRHGLPLSLADREAAAARIIASHPYWSDRAIAQTTGLSNHTVAAIRRRGPHSVPEERLGRDGRLRPLDPTRGRRIAREIITQRPEASLREVARAAGISPATARDVRLRMERGEDAVPSGRPRTGRAVRADREDATVRSIAGSDRDAPIQDPAAVLHGLRNDPSLRLTEAGRAFLRWFIPRAAGPQGWEELALNLPPHCKYTVAKLARHCASRWEQLAESIEQEASSMT